MKRDLRNRKDIELLVTHFYDKIKHDYLLNNFFKNFSNNNWEKHLYNMCNFWDNIIFYSGDYEGNPMNLHLHINKLSAIEKKHFNQWDTLFIQTVNELFEGEKAELIKNRALNISNIIQTNIFHKTT